MTDDADTAENDVPSVPAQADGSLVGQLLTLQRIDTEADHRPASAVI
jgi:hypothetical protein